MRKEKELYLAPILTVTPLCVESFTCASNLGSTINAIDEESDENEWSTIN